MKNKTSVGQPSVRKIKKFYAFVIAKSLLNILFVFIIMFIFPSVENNFCYNLSKMITDITNGVDAAEFHSYGLNLTLGLSYLGIVAYREISIIISVLFTNYSKKYNISENVYDSFLVKINQKFSSNHKWMFFLCGVYVLILTLPLIFSESYDFGIIVFVISLLSYEVIRWLLSKIFMIRETVNYLAEVETKKIDAQVKIIKEETRDIRDKNNDELYGKDPNKDEKMELAKKLDSEAQNHQENINNLDLLLKYNKLLDIGAITQEEFDQKKKELLK